MASTFPIARLYAALLLFLAPLLLSSCVVSTNPVTGNRRAYGYTWEQEVQIGKEADQQIQAQFGLYDDEELTNYVVRLGEQVLAESHLRRPDTDPEFRNTPFTFRVLDSPIINAFALPGGYVYVTRGLLAHLNNEAQLAVVLGHEVGHVAGRHASKRAATQQLGTLGLLGGALLGQGILGGSAGQNILDLGGSAAGLLFLRYGRDDERESDDLGVEYASLSGYDAAEGSAFFGTLKRLSAQAESQIPSFLSTHPDPGEREQTIQRLAAGWAQRVPATKTDQQSLYGVLQNIVLGEDPRQGFVQGNTFYHPELRFSFPVPGEFIVQNTPTQVALIEREQNAIMLFSFAQDASSARDAATKFAGQEGLQVIDTGEARAGSYPAHFVLADAKLQDGNTARLINYFIEYRGNVYTFLGYALSKQYPTYRDTFHNTIRAFSEVTDPSILNVEPTRLRVLTTPRSDAFSTFLPSPLPEGFTVEELAILNQAAVDETIEAGRRLKVPR